MDQVLTKGYLHQGTGAACVKFRFVKPGSVAQSVDHASAAGAVMQGVVLDSVDLAKMATGKVVVPVGLLGTFRVEASAAISKGAKVSTTATGLAKTAVATEVPLGIAQTAAAAAGDQIEVLLTPNLPVV